MQDKLYTKLISHVGLHQLDNFSYNYTAHIVQCYVYMSLLYPLPLYYNVIIVYSNITVLLLLHAVQLKTQVTAHNCFILHC